MSLMAANEESDPSAILNGFWVTLKAALPPCYISKNEEPANGIAGSFMLDRELSEAHSRWTTCGAKHRLIRTKNSSNSA